jgi:multidrug efflux pump subunit AcrB
VNVEQLLKNAYCQNYTYLIKTPIDQYKVIVEAEDQQRREPTDVKRLYFKPAGA